ncbi:hypothetical protein evm_004106 [Chilo suppressalis]|nr:hypothetical protein evm_004106 [Chilo suppressalis]
MDEKIKSKKLTAALEKELQQATLKPSWQSCNEGVHEKVNFDDTIWGFELAGGSYYHTPLRVTKVKPDSRADRAGIRIGDRLRTVNGLDTNMLTVREAHDIILDCGIELKLELYAPDVEETVYSVYQDEIDEEITEARQFHHFTTPVCDLSYRGAKTNEAWSICWPCSKKRDILYKESNCFLVPSAYEKKRRQQSLKKSDNGGE